MGASVKAIFASGDRKKIKKAINKRIDTWRRSLQLNDLGLDALPDELVDYVDRIDILELRGNNFTQLPAVVGRLTGLRTLNLRKNPLKSLPDWLADMPQLRELNLMATQLPKGVPEVFFAMPHLQSAAGVKNFGSGPKRTMMEAFFKQTKNMHATPRARAAAFELLQGHGVEVQTLSDLAASLQSRHPELYKAAEKALLARSPGVSLAEGHEVAVLGTTDFKKSDLKTSLKAQGIKYATKVGPKTTHIVMGRNPKNLANLDGGTFTFITEKQAGGMVQTKDKEKGFLEEAGPAADRHAENVTKLLLSGDPASIDMALNLVKAGGVSDGILTGLYAVGKLDREAKRRNKARKLLKQHAPIAVQKVVADRDKLAYEGSKAEQKTYSSLRRFARLCKEIDWTEIAYAIHRRTGHGLSYVVDHGDKDTALALLRSKMKGKALHFSDLYTPGYKPHYESSFSYYSPVAFPKILCDLTEVEDLTLSWCLFGELPSEIAKLDNLWRLDLTGNMLTKLPKEVGELTGLKELNIGQNAFTAFPSEIIEKLVNLKHLNIQGNRESMDGHIYQPITVPPDIRAALPNCKFIDGLTGRQLTHNGYHT